MKQKVQWDDLGREEAGKHVLCFCDQRKVVLHLMEPNWFVPAGDPTITKRAQ